MMEMSRTVFAAAAAALMLFSGCSTIPTYETAEITPRDQATAAASLEPGSGTIMSSAFMRQAGGGVVTCAGSSAFLIPATASGTAGLVRIFGGESGYVRNGGGTWIAPTYVTAPEPNRETTCDADGDFKFDRVKAGKWHIITSVLWHVAGNAQGGTVLETVDLAEGEELEIVISR